MQRFKDILCVAPAGSENEAVLKRAATLAISNRARLTVVDVFSGMPPDVEWTAQAPSTDEINAAIVVGRERRLKDLVSVWRGKIDIETKLLIGAPFLEVVREVLRSSRDLVIKAAESGGLLDRVFGTDDMHLLRKCPCPVWLVKPGAEQAYHSILAAVDVGTDNPAAELATRRELNRQILDIASSLALSEFAQLHVAHAWEAVGESALRGGFMSVPEERVLAYVETVRQQHQEALQVLIEDLAARSDAGAFDYLDPKIHLVKGWGRKEIPVLAGRIGADLVVMGTVARTGIPGFIMGNTAETILNRIDCSVLAIKPPGFATPVTLGE